jgi:ABC-2 type transport system permease protein
VRQPFGRLGSELAGCFAAPGGWLFAAGFAALATGLAFVAGGFLGRGAADLAPFFALHPRLYVVLLPAFSAWLWHAERDRGPALFGRFAAGWCFAAAALLMTLPLWLTANLFGRPDNGTVLAGYLASWLLAGAVLAIGAAATAIRRPAAAVATAAALSLGLAATGNLAVAGLWQPWAPTWLIREIAGASLVAHFGAIASGGVALADLFYFASLIAGFVAAGAILRGLARPA